MKVSRSLRLTEEETTAELAGDLAFFSNRRGVYLSCIVITIASLASEIKT